MEREKETCVSCWKLTEYYVNTPIDQRRNYLEGAGQLCEECAEGLNKGAKEARREGASLF